MLVTKENTTDRQVIQTVKTLKDYLKTKTNETQGYLGHLIVKIVLGI